MTHLATITATMQLTLPKRRCEWLGLTRGDTVALPTEDGKIVLTRLRP